MASGGGSEAEDRRASFETSTGLKVILRLRDIATFGGDAIVNGEGEKLDGKSKISQFLQSHGGPAYEKDKKDLISKHKPFKQGRVYEQETDKKVLKHRYVFHAIVPKYRMRTSDEWEQIMGKLYDNVMELANKLRLKKISMPLLGSGNAKAPLDKAAHLAVEHIFKYKPTSVEKICFFTLSEEAFSYLESCCDAYSSRVNPKPNPKRPSSSSTTRGGRGRGRGAANTNSNPSQPVPKRPSISPTTRGGRGRGRGAANSNPVKNTPRSNAGSPANHSTNTKSRPLPKYDSEPLCVNGGTKSINVRKQKGRSPDQPAVDVDNSSSSGTKQSSATSMKKGCSPDQPAVDVDNSSFSDTKQSSATSMKKGCSPDQPAVDVDNSSFSDTKQSSATSMKKGHSPGLPAVDMDNSSSSGNKQSSATSMNKAEKNSKSKTKNPVKAEGTQARSQGEGQEESENSESDGLFTQQNSENNVALSAGKCSAHLGAINSKDVGKKNQKTVSGNDGNNDDGDNADVERKTQKTVSGNDGNNDDVDRKPQKTVLGNDGNNDDDDDVDRKPQKTVLENDGIRKSKNCTENTNENIDDQETIPAGNNSTSKKTRSNGNKEEKNHQRPKEQHLDENSNSFDNINCETRAADASVRHGASRGSQHTKNTPAENGGSEPDERKATLDGGTKPKKSNKAAQNSVSNDPPQICVICMDEIKHPKTLNKCGHIFCRKCIDDCFAQFKPVCPMCNMVYGIVEGTQPIGKMNVGENQSQSLPGYSECGMIIIDYQFNDGQQEAEHPNPGKPYHGTRRVAYLPDNKEGRTICDLLEIAFKRKLIFTIGRSSTTGREDVVTWNDIHHKTRIDGGPTRFGYPDPGYLSRVRDELACKGVTEEDLSYTT